MQLSKQCVEGTGQTPIGREKALVERGGHGDSPTDQPAQAAQCFVRWHRAEARGAFIAIFCRLAHLVERDATGQHAGCHGWVRSPGLLRHKVPCPYRARNSYGRWWRVAFLPATARGDARRDSSHTTLSATIQRCSPPRPSAPLRVEAAKIVSGELSYTDIKAPVHRL